MRVGIIRGDLAAPLFLADLETVSQTNFPTEPVGQTRYIGRPSTTKVGTALAGIPGGLQAASAPTFSVVIGAGNKVLRLKINTGSFVVATLAEATYVSMTTLLAAINVALAAAGLAVTATTGLNAPTKVLFSTTTAVGPGTILTLDTNGNGSTANASLGFAAGGDTATVSTAATVITSLNPVAGTLDVSAATIRTQDSDALMAASAAQVLAIQDAIAPKFVETDVVLKSFQVGNLAKYRSATFVPDPSRMPAMSASAAISIVADDGSTPFTSTVPTISAAVTATPSAGDVTITGTGLGSSEHKATVLKFTDIATGTVKVIQQAVLAATLTGGTQGSVSATSIVVPASLIPGIGAGDKVQVLFTSLASNIFTITT